MKYERTCLWCGTSIVGKNPRAKYCTQQHKRNGGKARLQGRPMRKDIQRICPICKTQVPAERASNAFFCSEKCADTSNKRGDPFGQKIFQPKTCIDCGGYFEHIQINAVRCSDCRHKEIRNRHTHSRRCKKYGVPFQSFSISAIFHQDNWTCWVCNLPAPKELRGAMDPLAPELDHVIPLHMGPGISPGHVPSNCRCAHRKCNQARNL